MESSTVSYDLAVHLLSSDGHVLPLKATLHYDAADPLAVAALFDDGGHEPIRWVFARDLLASAMDELTGDGDVIIWPTQDAEGEPVVHIRLRSPHGDALLEASADELERFLIHTWRVVAPGTEHEHLNLDGHIAELLDES